MIRTEIVRIKTFFCFNTSRHINYTLVRITPMLITSYRYCLLRALDLTPRSQPRSNIHTQSPAMLIVMLHAIRKRIGLISHYEISTNKLNRKQTWGEAGLARSRSFVVRSKITRLINEGTSDLYHFLYHLQGLKSY